jgi:ABC-type transport system substrate-binding protein
MSAFTTQASDERPELLVAWGHCNAFSGRGDPYLPFRQVLNAFTGDVEATWAAGTITTDQARTVWEAMPVAIASLLKNGPDLLDTLLPSAPIQDRFASAYPAGHPLLTRLHEKAADKSPAVQMEQLQLFDQVTATLRRLAEQQPLIICLDDLQWADRGSLDLLFHLGRGLAGARILLLVAYRPDEVTAHKAHPLRPLLDEFRRTYGDIKLDLNRDPGRAFVDAYIDIETNRLNDSFRETFYKRTAGHPLFTVELLRDMQERGDLVKDESGAWTEGPSLDWDELPARVEGAIAARIGRLEEELRAILSVAAVEGQTFTAQVVARVQEVQVRRLLRTLSIELQRRYQLVKEQSVIQLGRQRVSHFQFSHVLFQRYLYNELGENERRFLHGDVAAILEELYAERLDEITVQLAHHYVEAGKDDKALPYLLRAGDKARFLYAFDDALQHYQRALDILKERGDFERAGQILMKMGLTYHGAFQFELSSQAYQEGFLMLRQAGKGQTTSQLPVPTGTIRTNLIDVNDLDPIMCHDLDSFRVSYQLFGFMLTLNEELDVVPDMAESWQILDDGSTYEFRLREGLYWSDGQPLTADDFAYRLTRELDPASEAYITLRWNELRGAVSYRRGEGKVDDLGIKVIDPRTIRLHLEQPSGTFMHELIHLAPIPAHIVEVYASRWTEPEHIVTCGPYLFESWDKGRALVLKSNPNYYGHYTGNVRQVTFKFFENTTDIIEAYDSDDLDILHLPRDMHWAIQQYPADYVTWPDFFTVKVNLNTLRFPFENHHLRRALVLATDRKNFVEISTNGLVTPATGGYIPLGLPGHRPNIALPYDLEGARKLLVEAGYPGGSGLPVIQAVCHKAFAQQKEYLDHLWIEKLGLKIEWTLVNWEEFDRLLDSGQIDLYIDGIFSSTPNPDNLMGNMGIDRRYWPGEAFRTLLQKSRTVTDPVKRINHYHQMEEILLEEIPLIPLFYGKFHFLVKPWIKNYRPPMGFLDYWKDVIVEPH